MSEQISSNKWKSLAKRLSGLIDLEKVTPKLIYNKLRILCGSQKDYFAPIFDKNPLGYIKVVYYIYSYLKTGDFELGDKIIPNLGYASILSTESETYYDSCDTCGGDGTTTCSECDGNGNVECNNCDSNGEEECYKCDGTGELPCDTCDGTGEDEEGNTCGNCDGTGDVNCDLCDGTGKSTCTICDGDKETTCPICNGEGWEDCEACYGNGEQLTDEIKYDKSYICTYDKNIKNSCELNMNTLTPIVKIDNTDEFWDNVINLKVEEEHAELLEEIEPDDIYCFYYDTHPPLVLTISDMSIRINGDYEDFYFDV